LNRTAAAPALIDLSEVTDYLRATAWGCWRFRWHAVAVAWGVSLVGWLVVFLIPDVYQASARVYVNTQSTLRPLLQGLAVNNDVLTDVNMMARAILSRPNLERLAHETDLDLQAKDKSSLDGVINGLQASIEITKDANNIVQITYRNNDRKRALAVVTALLNTFIEGSLGENRTDNTTAETFLVQKLREYESKLNEAESRLADFKRQNAGLMPGDNTDYFGRMQAESAKLEDLDGKLRLAQKRKAELQRQLAGEEPVFGLVPADEKGQGPGTVQDRQIAQFEAQLSELRLKYTDTHPDIVQIRKTIEELRAEKAKQAAANTSGKRTYSPLDLNPVYQQMKLQLSQAEVEVAQLETERADQSGVVSGLRRKVDTVPAVEAEFKRLTRDYDVIKTEYDELHKRVESARMSQDANKSKDDVTFRVIDPPASPARPMGPNRPLFMSLVLVVGLLFGLAAAFALNLTRPVFYMAKELERRFSIPVIGAIGLVRTPAEMLADKRSLNILYASIAGLVACYGLLIVFVSLSAGRAALAAAGQVAS
jgi:polysaccharide chain length determinant protein (PEP-CTERM system associated)